MKVSRLLAKMADMFPDLEVQNAIIDCHDTRKNEVFVTTDFSSSERTDY